MLEMLWIYMYSNNDYPRLQMFLMTSFIFFFHYETILIALLKNILQRWEKYFWGLRQSWESGIPANKDDEHNTGGNDYFLIVEREIIFLLQPIHAEVGTLSWLLFWH